MSWRVSSLHVLVHLLVLPQKTQLLCILMRSRSLNVSTLLMARVSQAFAELWLGSQWSTDLHRDCKVHCLHYNTLTPQEILHLDLQ